LNRIGGMPRKARLDAPGALHHKRCEGSIKQTSSAKDKKTLRDRLAQLLCLLSNSVIFHV